MVFQCVAQVLLIASSHCFPSFSASVFVDVLYYYVNFFILLLLQSYALICV
jgi:hypothetical protein